MAQFVRIRRMKRRPWRLGTTLISNTAGGTLVNLDDPAVKRDLLNTDTNTYEMVFTSADTLSGPALKQGTMPYTSATTDLTTPLTTAKIRFTSLMFKAGTVVSAMTVVSGTTTAQTGATPHSWGSLWTSDGTTLTCVAVSPDTVGLLVINTARTFTYGTAYTVPTDGMYVLGTMFAAGSSVPTLAGANVQHAAVVTAAGAVNGNEATATRSTPVALATTVLVSDVTNDLKVPYISVA